MYQQHNATTTTRSAQPPPIAGKRGAKKRFTAFQKAIPQLPKPLAVLCCVLNFIMPGTGTIVAGFSVLCCGNVGQSGKGRFGTFCVNFWVGILQLLLVFAFFIGWVWSIMWGIAFIASTESASKKTTTHQSSASNRPFGLPRVES